MNNDAAKHDTLSREEEVFDAARKLADAAQRSAFVASACDGDSRLRERVERLLQVRDQAETLFTECTSVLRSVSSEDLGGGGHEILRRPAAVADEAPGALIGPYRIVRKIGEGGCGAVYVAEQDKPVRRRVALKIIKLGMDTRSVIARFEVERQALAIMDHPHIAKALDAGATETGRPYFVMEVVEGTKVTEYCDRHRFRRAAAS